MAPKRPRIDDGPVPEAKKSRSAFSIGPDNLPDGTWRRKVIKIKKDLIHKAKIKKSYAKVKAREPPVDRPIPEQDELTLPKEPSQQLHPERQAMLDEPEESSIPTSYSSGQRHDRKRPRKPGYFEKETAFAEKRKAEAEARRIEFERQDKERSSKIEERERFRKAMAKARTGGKNGQRKLGRESKVLLERVRRVVAK